MYNKVDHSRISPNVTFSCSTQLSHVGVKIVFIYCQSHLNDWYDNLLLSFQLQCNVSIPFSLYFEELMEFFHNVHLIHSTVKLHSTFLELKGSKSLQSLVSLLDLETSIYIRQICQLKPINLFIKSTIKLGTTFFGISILSPAITLVIA